MFRLLASKVSRFPLDSTKLTKISKNKGDNRI